MSAFIAHAHRRRHLANAALALMGLLLLLSIGGVVVRVDQRIKERRANVVQTGESLAQILDHELNIHNYNVMALGLLADRLLTHRVKDIENPVVRLFPVPAQDGYASQVPESFGPLATQGRMMGMGPVPQPDASVVEEMTMAVGLTPLMRAIRARSAHIPWVYYTSVSGFMFLFPAQEALGVNFDPEMLEQEFISGARPEVNPDRKIFWSRVYQDIAGKGSMLTASQPIYRDDIFLGSVSIDVSIKSLQRALDLHALPDASIYIYGQDDRPLVFTEALNDSPEEHEHTEVSLPLNSAPWRMELKINQAELVRAAMRDQAVLIGAVAMLALTLLSLILLLRSARRIHQMSIRDGLTGLFNRRHFDTLAPQLFLNAQRSSHALGLAVLDVDFFKKYNDSYGHQQGDVGLRAVAQALSRALHRSSDLVFRVGGEEFAVLVALQDGEHLAQVLERLNQAIRDLDMPHRQHPAGRMTISIGATVVHPCPALSVDEAYKRADDALYQAKSTGRDRAVCWSPATTASAGI